MEYYWEHSDEASILVVGRKDSEGYQAFIWSALGRGQQEIPQMDFLYHMMERAKH